MIHWLFATIRAMVAVFGRKARRLAIEVAFGFGRAPTAAMERLRSLESLLAQDAYGNPVTYLGHQVVACEYKPEGAYPDHPYLVTCVNADWRVSVARAMEFKLLSPEWVEEPGTDDRKIDNVFGFCGIPRLISDEELHELRLMQFAHRLAEEAGILKGLVTYVDDGTVTVTRKSRPHSRGEATERELFQDRHSIEEDDTRERQHYLLNERLRNRLVPTPQRNLIYREDPKGRLHETEESYGFAMREPGNEADPDREVEVKAYWDHPGYDGIVPLRESTKKERGVRERPRYRLGWDILFAGETGNGSFGLAKFQDWRQLGLRLPGGKTEKATWRKYWNKEQVFPEFLTLHNLEERTDKEGKRYEAAGSILVADGARDPDWIRVAQSSKEGRKALKVKPEFKAELEAMLRGIVESEAMDAIRFVRKDQGWWARGDGRAYPFGALSMPCNTCLKRAERYGSKEGVEAARPFVQDAMKRVWRSSYNADYCPICDQQMWQVKCVMFASTKLLPFVNWTAFGYTATHFAFEIFGDHVRDLAVKHGIHHGGETLRLKPAAAIRVEDLSLFGADALPPARFEWPVFEDAPVNRTMAFAFMDEDRFGDIQ